MTRRGGRPAKVLDPRLKEWATPRQAEVVDAVIEHGSMKAAARALGILYTSVQGAVAEVEQKATVQGWAPDYDRTHPVPEPERVKGVSTYYNAEGKASGQWVKTQVDQQAYNEMVKAAIGEFIEGVEPINVPPASLDFQHDIIPWIQIGDAHIGMLAHAAEVGENFDLKIAEAELCGAISILIDEMPNCERIVVNDLGDATHYDNMAAVTAASGHPLDADGRHPKMLRVYSRTMRFIVDKCLTKCRVLDVIINQGNHSRINDFWMRELLTVAYGHTGRVNVLDNDNVFIGYRMGNTLVMVHHSDKTNKPRALADVMTTDFRKDFGETEHHYIDTGHVHHHFVSKEHPGVIVESWNHLAANDSWAHDKGYRSRKAISIVLRSRTYGDMGRRVLSIQEIRDRLSKTTGARPQPKRLVHTV